MSYPIVKTIWCKIYHSQPAKPRVGRDLEDQTPIGPTCFFMHTHIACLPLGICSWDYRLTGPGIDAVLEFFWISESGSIQLNGHTYSVEKQGIGSGCWHLRTPSEHRPVQSAQKSSMFTRSVDFETTEGHVRLEAVSAFSRTMRMVGAGMDAQLSPSHVFTRRANLVGQIPVLPTAAFVCWVALLLWRRSQNSS